MRLGVLDMVGVTMVEKVVLSEDDLEDCVRKMLELIKDKCIEAIKKEPDSLPNSDSIQRGFVRGINYATRQVESVFSEI